MRLRFLPIIILAAALGLTGCGARLMEKGSGADYAAGSAMSAKSAYVADNGAYMEEAYEEAAEYDMMATSAVEAPAYAGSGSESIAPQQTSGVRKLVRNVSMELETLEYDELFAGLESKVAALGGYVEQSSTSGGGQNQTRRFGNIIARIPSDRVDDFIEQVDGISNITYKSESVEDITLNYVDTESRKKALEIERDRLLELMEKAESVADIIEIESRLSQVRYELDSTASRLRVMDNQVDYSTVNISISEVKVYTPPEKRGLIQEIRERFAENLDDAGLFLREIIVLLISGIPQIAILVVFIVVMILIIKGIVKLLKRKVKLPSIRRKEKDKPSGE